MPSTVELTLHDALGISFDHIGVAGSILWKGHSFEQSDVNMNIYGFETSWKLHNNYEALAEGKDDARLRELADWKHAIARVHETLSSVGEESAPGLAGGLES